jgi:sarcinarray family protein
VRQALDGSARTIRSLFLIFIFLILSTSPSIAAENEWGVVKAWFNDIPATAEDITLKVGETAKIRVEVKTKIDVKSVWIELTEVGVTRAFEVVDGPSEIDGDKGVEEKNVPAGWSNTYTWTIRPNGKWTNGNAPINIFVQFTNFEDGRQVEKKIYFTIANPYIEESAPLLPKQPGFEIVLAFCGLILMYLVLKVKKI